MKRSFSLNYVLLNNVQGWVEKEKGRLCESISETLREKDSISPKIKAKLSLQDDNEVRRMFAIIATGRWSFADFVTDSLNDLTVFSLNHR